MDKRSVGIIATVATALICGCPGLFAMCFGLFFAVVGQIPGADVNVFNSSDPRSALVYGLVALCLGILFVAVPVVVGIVTLRKKPGEEPVVIDNEPVPPVN